MLDKVECPCFIAPSFAWHGQFKLELVVVRHLVDDMFDLHNLGWNSFQQLCLTITREILGQTVESFLDSRDGGRDGAFTGTWSLRDGRTSAAVS